MNKENAVWNKLVNGAGILAITAICGHLFAFVYSILFANLFGPEKFGVFSLGIVIAAIAAVFAKFGLGVGVQHFAPYFQGKSDTPRMLGAVYSTLGLTALFSLVLMLVLLVFSGTIANILHLTDYHWILILFLLTVPFIALLHTSVLCFMGLIKPFYASLVQIFLQKGGLLVIACIAFLFGLSLGVVSVLYFLMLFFSTLIAGILLKKTLIAIASGQKPKYQGVVIKLIKYSTPLFLVSVFGLVFGWIDSLMVGVFLGPTEVGFYRIAFAMASAIVVFASAFGSMYQPLMSNLFAQGKFEKISENYASVIRISFLLTLPVSMLFLFFSKDLVSVLFGIAFLPSANILVMLSIGFSILVLSGPGEYALRAIDKPMYIFKLTFFIVIFNILLNLILIPWVGLMGAAISTTLSLVIMGVLAYLKTNKSLDLNINWGLSAQHLLVALLLCFSLPTILIDFFPIESVYLNIGIFVLTVPIYFLVIYFAKLLTKEDFSIIKQLMYKFRNKNNTEGVQIK